MNIFVVTVGLLDCTLKAEKPLCKGRIAPEFMEVILKNNTSFFTENRMFITAATAARNGGALSLLVLLVI
jgi:hypothetical protein